MLDLIWLIGMITVTFVGVVLMIVVMDSAVILGETFLTWLENLDDENIKK